MSKENSLVKVKLKTKEQILKLGYEDSTDPEYSINKLAGQIVTINLSQAVRIRDLVIYECEEYKGYAIYHSFISRIVEKTNTTDRNKEEYTYQEIGDKLGISPQGVGQILQSAIYKLIKNQNKYFSNNLDLEEYYNENN